MKIVDDGVIKYDRSNFSYLPTIPTEDFSEIEYWRELLFQLSLIGVEPESEIGYGNISQKKSFNKIHETTNPQFVITGTQTGKFKNLDQTKYTRVLDFDLSTSKIFVMGPIEASSEALTHAALYLSNLNIKVIIHIHSHLIWNYLLQNSLNKSREIPYGTQEMAEEAFEFGKNRNSGFLAMSGHLDGVIYFGSNFKEIFEIIKNHLNHSKL